MANNKGLELLKRAFGIDYIPTATSEELGGEHYQLTCLNPQSAGELWRELEGLGVQMQEMKIKNLADGKSLLKISKHSISAAGFINSLEMKLDHSQYSEYGDGYLGKFIFQTDVMKDALKNLNSLDVTAKIKWHVVPNAAGQDVYTTRTPVKNAAQFIYVLSGKLGIDMTSFPRQVSGKGSPAIPFDLIDKNNVDKIREIPPRELGDCLEPSR